MLTDMDPATRQILKDLQTQAGVPTDTYSMDDFPGPVFQDDGWFDDPDDQELPPEKINIADAARTLRLHL